MRIPHAFSAVINPTVRLLLRSPLHQFWSGSLMLVTFTGRNSGRVFTIPVRYLQHDGKIRCFTSCTNQWWRNLRGGADVSLYVAGRSIHCPNADLVRFCPFLIAGHWFLARRSEAIGQNAVFERAAQRTSGGMKVHHGASNAEKTNQFRLSIRE